MPYHPSIKTHDERIVADAVFEVLGGRPMYGALAARYAPGSSLEKGMIGTGLSFSGDFGADEETKWDVLNMLQPPFGVSVDEADVPGIRTVGDTVRYFQRRRAEHVGGEPAVS